MSEINSPCFHYILRKKRLTFRGTSIGVNFICFPRNDEKFKLEMGGRLIHEVDLYTSKYGTCSAGNIFLYSQDISPFKCYFWLDR